MVVVRGTRRGRWFFAGFALAAAAVVLIGFSRTYYFKAVSAAPTLPALFHVHGVLFTAWMLVFIAQTFLIAHARTALHKRLGIAASLLIVPMLVSGVIVAVAAAKGQGPLSTAVANGEFDLVLPDIPPLTGMVIPLASVLLFSAFVAVGLAYRRRPDVHKRWMALGAIALLPPALGRALATLTGTSHPALFFGSTILFLAALGVHDWRTRGRVHPVTLWGGLFLAASFPARLALGRTEQWLKFAAWLTGVPTG